MPEKSIGKLTIEWEWFHQLGKGGKKAGKPAATKLELGAPVVKDGFVQLISQNIMFGAKCSVSNPGKDEFKIGFTNTIYLSERRSFYRSSRNTMQTDHIKKIPVWDGDDDIPWYDSPAEFDDKNLVDEEVYFNDAPTFMNYRDNSSLKGFKNGSLTDPSESSKQETLFCIDGEDSFECWLAIEVDGKIHALDGIPWYVCYQAIINPVHQTVILLDDSGTYVSKNGSKRTGKAKIDGPSGLSLLEIQRSAWTKKNLPEYAHEWLFVPLERI